MLLNWDRMPVCRLWPHTIKSNLNIFVSIIVCLITMSFFPVSAQAAICFLPDCGDKTNTPTTNDGAEKCRKEGYESFQNRVCHQYSIVEFCPYNSNYIKCNNKQWCIINDYTKTECEKPYELFNKCPNGEEMYKECKMNMEEACKAEDPTYTDTCPAGWVIDPNDHCTYSEDFGHCCNTCPGFITKEELGDQTAVASCDSCDGKKYIAASDGFNMCEGYWDCQDGCAPDAKTCVSFGVTKCDKCKRCEAKCKNETCPEGAICEYEACTWRYCDPTGCKVGYVNFCSAPESTDCTDLGYDTAAGACKGMGEIVCPFDDKLIYCIPDNGKCCETLCSGYEYSKDKIPVGYIGTASCTCCTQTMYKIGINPCTGYINEKDCPYGPDTSSGKCISGSGDEQVIKYRRCKECPNACPGNTVCPEGAICTKDTCSNTYCPTGCATNYKNYCGTVITNCDTLGYKSLSSACASDDIILYCPYDNQFAICMPQDNGDCCRTCEAKGYIYDSIPKGYTKTGECKCCDKTKYSAKLNACSGYVTADECEFGGDGATCQRGDVLTYAKCKECPNACEYEVCPTGAVCSKDSCSNTYCPTGCATGYKNYCNTNDDCDALGYHFMQSDCAGREFIRCPYDTQFVFCE